MFQAILEFVWEFFVDCVLMFFWWVVLFPVLWLVTFPFILVIAAFRERPYWIAVGNMSATVYVFWRDTIPTLALQ